MKCASLLVKSACVVLLIAQAAAQESRIELHTISSAALGINKSFNVLLPKGYDQSAERYPVLYLFRGHEREWADLNPDGSVSGVNAKVLVDTLVEKGLIGNLIVVMPGLSSTDNSVPAFTVNFLHVELAGGKDGLGTGKFEDYMLNELMPYVDAHFRTLPTRWLRGVDGFSFGGFTSMLLATKHPTMFCSAGDYDGTLMWLDFVDKEYGGADFWYTDPMFDPHFGSPRDVPYMTQYNASNNVKNGSPEYIATLSHTQFLIHGATDPSGNNLDRNTDFVAILNSKGIPNGFPDIALAPVAIHNWFYAYMHMRLSLPLHWQKFQNAPNTLAVHGITPTGPLTVSASVPIHWSRESRNDTLATILEYSSNAGATWHEIQKTTSNDTTFVWNTSGVSDGTRYLVRATVYGDTSFGRAVSLARFTVNNPGNGAPDLALLSPQKNDMVSGQSVITWFAEDAEGSTLQISLEGSANGGATWESIAENIPNTGSYTWDSRNAANSTAYRILISCTDGVNAVRDTSKPFSVFNQRSLVQEMAFHHVSGSGGGAVHGHVTNPSRLTGDTYRITFDDTSSQKSYSVVDLVKNVTVVQGATELNGTTEGPEFDGLRLLVADYPVAIPDTHATKWAVGASNMFAHTLLPQLNIGNQSVNGTPYPADYRFSVYDHVVDTSSTYLDLPAIPMYFTVWNLTENHKVAVLYYELDNDHKLSLNDFVYILEKDSNGQPLLTWEVVFDGAMPFTPPSPGDVFDLRFFKPFTSADRFEFQAMVEGVGPANNGAPPGMFSLEQNYPNPFNPSTTFQFSILKTQLTILKVYDILGREVATLVNEILPLGPHTFLWNARGLASGVYFYRLRSGEFTSTKKLLILR